MFVFPPPTMNLQIFCGRISQNDFVNPANLQKCCTPPSSPKNFNPPPPPLLSTPSCKCWQLPQICQTLNYGVFNTYCSTILEGSVPRNTNWTHSTPDLKLNIMQLVTLGGNHRVVSTVYEHDKEKTIVY